MKTIKNRHKSKKKVIQCTECTHCLPMGEGDFLCDEWDKMAEEPIVVIADYVHTSDFAMCNGKYFEK